MIALTALALAITGFMSGYLIGALRNVRRPVSNHLAMTRLLERLIQRDEMVPILTNEERATVDRLVEEFQRLPTTPMKEIR